MSMRALASLDALVPFSIRDRAPWERSMAFEPEPAPGDPPAPPPEPKKLELTQAQLDAMILDRVKKSTAEAADLKAKLDEIAKAQAELVAKNEELELKGKSADEKARIAAEKAAKKIEDEKAQALKGKAESDALAAAAQTELRNERVGNQVSAALVAAKALPTSLHHALPAFLADLTIETDEKHKVTSITLAGVAHKTLTEAASEWLKTNPHFAPHVGGAGTRGGAGGNTHGGRPLHELSPNELLAIDAATSR